MHHLKPCNGDAHSIVSCGMSSLLISAMGQFFYPRLTCPMVSTSFHSLHPEPSNSPCRFHTCLVNPHSLPSLLGCPWVGQSRLLPSLPSLKPSQTWSMNSLRRHQPICLLPILWNPLHLARSHSPPPYLSNIHSLTPVPSAHPSLM